MKPAGRKLLAGADAVGRRGGLLLALLLLGAGSSIAMRLGRAGRLMHVELSRGVLYIAWADPPMPGPIFVWSARVVRPHLEWSPGRGWLVHGPWGGPANVTVAATEAGLPLWIPAAVVLIPTTLAWIGRYRKRRRSPTDCAACGYDLRGSSADACPECGHSGRNEVEAQVKKPPSGLSIGVGGFEPPTF
jgi:hypothetical protein